MIKLTNNQKRWWQFLIVMTNKEIKAKYKMTFFGSFWTFINPIIQMLVMGYIFSFFVPVKVDNYFVFIFSGLLIWNFVTSTILRAVTIIINERSLIQKSNFPKEVLVLSIVASNFIHLLISFGLFMVVVVFMGNFHWQWLLLPLVMIPLLMLTSGLSLFFAALNVKHRDISFIVQMMITIWFYLTPIIYSLELIPTQQVNWFIFNPMVGIIDITRLFFMGLPTKFLYIDLISMSWSLIIFVVGTWVFKKTSLFFNEWI